MSSLYVKFQPASTPTSGIIYECIKCLTEQQETFLHSMGKQKGVQSRSSAATKYPLDGWGERSTLKLRYTCK